MHGVVLDVKGAPLAGVPIATQTAPRRALAESDARGRFQLAVDPIGFSAELIVFEGHFATVRGCTVRPENADETHVLVAAPAIDVAGLVVDEHAAPLVGARVTAYVDDHLLHDFPLPLDRSRNPWRHSVTGEDGRFRLERLPRVGGATLRADHDGHRSGMIDLPGETREDLVIELVTSEEEALVIRGRVLLPDREPAVDAVVGYDGAETRTDAQGGFTLEPAARGPGGLGIPDEEGGIIIDFDREMPEEPVPVYGSLPLAAAKPGYTPALYPGLDELLAAWHPYPPPPITLILGETPLVIAGVLVDEAGSELLDRWVVDLLDGTPLTDNQVPVMTAESLGGADPQISVAADGAFRVEGLLDRDYRLRARSLDHALAVTSEPVPAGSEGVRVEIPADALLEELVGRVVDRRGIGVAGARITVHLTLNRQGSSSLSTRGSSAVTDAEGEFRLARVPRRGVSLGVSGSEVMPAEIGVEELERRIEAEEEPVLEVARRRHFRVTILGAGEGTVEVQFLDERDRSLMIYDFSAGGYTANSSLTISLGGDGNGTGVRSVSEDAVLLRATLREEGTGIRDLDSPPVHFAPDGVTEIEIDAR